MAGVLLDLARSNTLCKGGSKAASPFDQCVFRVDFVSRQIGSYVWIEVRLPADEILYIVGSGTRLLRRYHQEMAEPSITTADQTIVPFRFRLSKPFDSRRWVVLFSSPLQVSSFVRPSRYIRIFVAFLYHWASRNQILYLTSFCLEGFAGPRPAWTSGGLQLLLDVCCKHCQRALFLS